MSVMTENPSTLLRVGAPEWAAINAEEARQATGWARARTVGERVEAGMRLSRTAHEILVSVRAQVSGARPA